MENLIVAVNCVIPVFICLAVGYIAKMRRVIPEGTYPYINRFSFTVLLSVQMFHNVYSAEFNRAFSPRLIAYLLGATLFIYITAGLIFRHAVKDPRTRGAYWQDAYRTNVAIVGIALMEVLSDANGVALMTIAVSILVPLYNVLAVIALELCSGRKVSIGTALRNVLKNPLIIGAGSGILVRFIGLRLPSAVESAVASLGKTGMTMALLTLGASFDFSEVGKNLRRLLFGNIMRLIIVPLITVGCAVFFGFRGDELAVILLCGATPVATTAFSMAQVYNSDYELTGQLVVTTSLMSCPTLFVWILALKQLHLI